MALDRPFDEFRLQMATGEDLPVESVRRGDLARLHPDLPHAIDSGFRFQVTTDRLIDDRLEGQVVGRRDDRSVAAMRI